MIKRIICYGFLFCLFIALALALMGIRHVEIGAGFQTFLRSCDNDFASVDSWKIPDIPDIPKVPSTGGFQLIVNAFIGFFNFFIGIANFIILILNFIWSVIKYLVILLKNLFMLRDVLANISA